MNPPRVILDTDIFSEVIKGVDGRVVNRARTYLQTFSVLSFSSLSVFEILHGLQSKLAVAKIERSEAVFAQNDEIVPTSADYRLAGEISGALARKGTPIGLVDPIIAACAIRRGYKLATGNTSHFVYIVAAGYQLELENWRD